jgi:hydroxyacylglutathione hydrolase
MTLDLLSLQSTITMTFVTSLRLVKLSATISPRQAGLLSGKTPPCGGLASRPLTTQKNIAAPPSLDMAYGPVNAFQMNQYVIACTATRQAAIIDCGASSLRELDGFLKWINDKNYELSAVWQTHAHLDHVAGLGLLVAKYPNIPIYLHPKEQGIYNAFAKRCQDYGFTVEGGTGSLPCPDTRLTYFDVEVQTTISLGDLTFDIIPVPGHSPGQVGFLEAKHTKSFFGGDFIMQGSIGRTDFADSSPADMNASLKRFVETMDDDTIIYPGHGPPTMLKQEKLANPFLRPYVRGYCL